MSIYACLPGIDDDSPCGEPWLYRGSHVLPAETDPRGGAIDLAAIPSHITRDGRDDTPEDGRPRPWLRLAVLGDEPAAVINPEQARYLAAQLTDWADDAEPAGDTALSYPPGTFGPHVRPQKQHPRLFVRYATPPVPAEMIADEQPLTEVCRAVAAKVLAQYPNPTAWQNTAETATGARQSDEHPLAGVTQRPGGENSRQAGADGFQPAYDAVFAYIRGIGDHLPPDPVHCNALIWHAVHAALGALDAPVPTTGEARP